MGSASRLRLCTGASGVCPADVYMAPLPSPGQGVEWEPQTWWVRARALGRMEPERPCLRVQEQEPLHLPALITVWGLFKGSGTFFHMYLWGSGWQVGMVGAVSEPLPLPGSLPPPRASLGTFVF